METAFDTPLHVGPVRLSNRAFLAPMSGVSDLPFRRLALRFGAGAVISEMVACESVALGSDEARLRAEGEGLDLHIVQLTGREPSAMAEGVKVAEAAGAAIIDINMGCPAKRVTTGYAGSALMRDLDLAVRIIEATIAAASVPVTVKMRLGWDENSLNAPVLAARAEAAGVRMITVHGRTRCQFYNGRADWNAIRRVKDAVSVPVVANGDLTDPKDAPAVLAASGADAVMVGRGSYGRPWVPGQVADVLAGQAIRPAPEGAALGDLVIEHYQAILGHYGLVPGIRIARKHLGWYLDGLPAVPEDARRAVLTGTDHHAIERLLATLFGDQPVAVAA
jgi:tRNA-dihydrouridine synthase B